MPQAHFEPRRLLELLDIAQITYSCRQPLDTTLVSGIFDDSRRLEPGSLFVAIEGTLQNGHQFVPQAIDAGVSAVVISDPKAVDRRLPCLLVSDTRQALASLAAAYTGLTALQKRQDLKVIGVTGTNGKSTTCHLIRNILQAAGHRTALLGTISYDLVGRQLEAPWTTPPALPLAEYLIEAHSHGARYAVMEVSSHALDQRRTDGVRFDAAVFTNFSGDHLDYHRTAESYLRSKKLLFDRLSNSSSAVINAHDPVAEVMVDDCAGRVIRFGFDQPADVVADEIQCDIRGSHFRLVVDGQRLPISLPLIGRHNISNALAAATTAAALDVDLATIGTALNESHTIPGRLERAEPDGHPFTVLVDYAHTDDALENVLSALRPLTRRQLWCVFGCGGDRDRTKRPRMARVAAKHADRIVITSDNPRSEEPMQIIQEVLAGFGGRLERVAVEQNRLRAIHLAIGSAEPGDVVLIAGKGHEDYQHIGDQRLHFDDVEVVQKFIKTGGETSTFPETRLTPQRT